MPHFGIPFWDLDVESGNHENYIIMIQFKMRSDNFEDIRIATTKF